jgi:hypothetical protein
MLLLLVCTGNVLRLESFTKAVDWLGVWFIKHARKMQLALDLLNAKS